MVQARIEKTADNGHVHSTAAGAGPRRGPARRTGSHEITNAKALSETGWIVYPPWRTGISHFLSGEARCVTVVQANGRSGDLHKMPSTFRRLFDAEDDNVR